LVVPVESMTKIREHLEASYPEEGCGGLIGVIAEEHLDIVETVRLENVQETERHRRYLIGPDDVLQLERRVGEGDLQVIGYYHSHPDGPPEPSEFDREHAWPLYVYLIASVENGCLTCAQAWRLTEDRECFSALQTIVKR